MSDPVPPAASTWLTYAQAADRLGLRNPAAAAARARRGRWPKRIRNTDGVAEILMPAELLATGPEKAQEAHQPPTPPSVGPNVTDAVRAAVAPLQALLEAQATELKAARTTLDAIRGDLADAQADAAAAKARADTLAAQVEREVGDRRTLQSQADSLRDQLHATQLDAAKAHGDARTEAARREAAEARARDLQAQLDALQARQRRRWWPW